ncbi:MAG: RNAse Z [Bacteroidota bacterium]
MNLTITGYSTALFSTWYFVDELGLLFDAGDGVAAGLLQKSRKIRQVFISHADRDHLTGLHQLNQLNARNGFPVIHFPKDSGSFPAIEAFSKAFDPHVSGTIWKPVIAGEKTWIRDDMYVEAVRNSHVKAPDDVFKSLGYKVITIKRKIKAELALLPPATIKSIIMEQGQEATTVETFTTILSYSADTPVENFDHWNGSETLIHEATFLGGDDAAHLGAHGNRHSTLDEVLQQVSIIKIGQLILGHFSSRYAPEQIDAAIQSGCKKYGIKIPVYRVLPGEKVVDILQQSPVNM